jgi:antitoxin (DNA-binding transcriptional repressor) of toxin-antitoxin stability system
MKEVQSTGEPVIVTKRGTPVVKIVPVQSEKNDIFGFMMEKVKIVGDIESPISCSMGDFDKVILLDMHVLVWLTTEPTRLAKHSSDQCDRLIGAPALAEGMVLISKDEKIRDCKQPPTFWQISERLDSLQTRVTSCKR